MFPTARAGLPHHCARNHSLPNDISIYRTQLVLRCRRIHHNGADPVRAAGVDLFTDQFRQAGYQAIQREWYEIALIEKELRAIHCSRANAKLALIGYSAGTYAVKRLSNRLLKEGFPIVLVGYVGGDYLSDTEDSRIRGSRVVNIMGDGHLLTAAICCSMEQRLQERVIIDSMEPGTFNCSATRKLLQSLMRNYL